MSAVETSRPTTRRLQRTNGAWSHSFEVFLAAGIISRIVAICRCGYSTAAGPEDGSFDVSGTCPGDTATSHWWQLLAGGRLAYAACDACGSVRNQEVGLPLDLSGDCPRG